MIKKYLAVLFLFFFVFNGHGYGEETKKNAPDYYTLVEQLKNNDKSVDFTALRYAYTKTRDYNPYGSEDDADKDAMYKALNNEEFEKAVKHAQAVLEKNYVDLDTHFDCYIAYREMKNAEKQKFHDFVLRGLLGSIYGSGDGQTPETALVVINTREEYFFFNANGYEVISQSLVAINDHNYDKVEVKEKKSGEKTVFYFNIDMPFNWLSSQMGEGKQ